MPAYLKDDEEEDNASPADASAASDFRSRYPVETAGMPANLAAIAARNLAAEDTSVAKVNAVSRVVSPSEGYARVAQYQEPGTEAATRYPAGAGRIDFNAGTVTGNVPSFQASMNPGADFGISDAMERSSQPLNSSTPKPTLADLHTDDISQRRAAIDEQRKQIQARLGIIQPREAGLAAVVLAGPKERAQLLQNWQLLDHEDKSLLQEHHYNAIDAARTAHENFTRQNHITAANDFAAMANELNDLHQNAKPGTPEFAAGTLDIAKRHPAGFQTQAGQTLFRGVTGLHDKMAELEDRSYWQRFGQAFKEASQVARKHGVEVQYDEQGFPSIESTAKYGEENGSLKPETKVPAAYVQQAAALAEAKARKDAAFNANPKADLTSHDRNITIAQTRLDAMKEALGLSDKPAVPSIPPVPSATPAPTDAPSATPDLKTLAQKALNDPNASEAHKAAAKKILGL